MRTPGRQGEMSLGPLLPGDWSLQMGRCAKPAKPHSRHPLTFADQRDLACFVPARGVKLFSRESGYRVRSESPAFNAASDFPEGHVPPCYLSYQALEDDVCHRDRSRKRSGMPNFKLMHGEEIHRSESLHDASRERPAGARSSVEAAESS